MDAMEALFTRRSVRSFTGEGIEPKQLTEIIRAGMYAPSAHDRRPWRFLTVEDPQKREALMPLCRWWKMLGRAGVAVVVCADRSQASDIPEEYLVNGCSAACENMLLAAHALGLGGVWLGICDADSQIGEFKKILGIPSEIKVIGMLAIGRPAGAPGQEDRFEPEKWHREVWGK